MKNVNKDIMLIKHLIKVGQDAEKEGLCRHKTGNFSIFSRTTGHVYITPSGIARSTLTPQDIIITDLEGTLYDNFRKHKPSIELSMHLAVYKAREDVNAIVHTHSTYATAFSVKGIKISPIVTEASVYNNNVELVEYAPPGSEELAELLVEPVQKADVCLLKNHGLLAVGDSIEDAYLKAVYAEKVAQIEYIYKNL